MSTALTEPAVVAGLEIVVDVDLEAVPMCEHDQHDDDHEPDDPAAMIARVIDHGTPCPLVGVSFLLCLSGAARLQTGTLRCRNCDTRGLRFADILTTVRL